MVSFNRKIGLLLGTAEFTDAEENRRLQLIEEIKNSDYLERLSRRPGAEIETLNPLSIEVYELYREKIVHEDLLINFRTSWFVALQAFLFSAFALSIGRSGGEITPIPTLLFSFVGLFSCGFTYISVNAADNATKKTASKWTDQYIDVRSNRFIRIGVRDIVDPMGLLPAIKGGGSEGKLARQGAYLSNGLPIVIMVFWVLVAALVVPGLLDLCQLDTSSWHGCAINQAEIFLEFLRDLRREWLSLNSAI